jgi:hypothetical protein
MSKKNILFIVHTEYQMMVTLSAIADNYADTSAYQVTICQIDDGLNRRFRFKVNLGAMPSIEYVVLNFYEGEKKFNRNLADTLKNFTERSFHILVIFNQHLFVDIYLAKIKSRQGCVIHLGPDGLKPYNTTNKFAPRWALQRAIAFLRFAFVNKLKLTFHFPTLTYANLNCIDEVWIQYENSFENKLKKKIRKIDVMNSEDSRLIINSFFSFNPTTDLPKFSQLIFYINQPLEDEVKYEYELEVLKNIHARFPDYLMIVKFHPLTPAIQKERVKNLSFLKTLETSIMAELYITNLSNSLIISFWSAALLINNTSCRFYWLHPMLSDKGLMPDYIKLINPTEHIIEVGSLQAII